MSLIPIARRLCDEVSALSFGPPVAYVYNPLVYARASHETYLRRFGVGRPQVVLLGMNPGPFGMAQTGVPFGDLTMVRDWLGIEAAVDRPEREHPKRPVAGFQCRRGEVSGQRLWGWARARFESPERFFEQFFVANYCPLAFLEEGGRNRTPDALPKAERETLFAACDRGLRAMVEVLAPAYVIGIGQFAANRALDALNGLDVSIGRILHPSPASPAANRGWAEQAEAGLRELGVMLPE
ncbi:uracil DNA glycosylase superfamily protein [Thioflavicoccus mobilis 8321]|uniref:Uracil DNA glycosylase superfamily protein n=1 Tax=Thioflavicoccus mobilis 8321 TaxID=765912 RepID=L0GZ21_9GAMM|nr:uracil-DNA glycosylase family protein [Thioflavicoccus mobilis]AGA90630.1 uracil DNA glycosylase superfamily protein [Thioflavicoccus mobilis 8321]